MQLWYTMDATNAEEDWFCPTYIQHCPNNQDVLEVLNNCGGFNQKILKYKIGDVSIKLINKVNLNALNNEPFFCPMGDEFIVGSTLTKVNDPLYSFGTTDDLNYWSVPKELLGDNFWQYSCLSDIKRFVVYGFNANNTIDATVMVGNRGSDQLTRYSNVIKGVKATDGQAFVGIDGSIVHWFNTDKGSFFYETFNTPILELTAKAVTKATQVDVTLTFTNAGQGKKVLNKKVTINP